MQAACFWFNSLPARVRSIILEGQKAPGTFLVQPSLAMGVSEKDLKKNKAYLFPMLERYQEGTPPTYFIADMFMLVDMMADGQFLTRTSVWPKTKDLALAEASWMKRMLMHVRRMRMCLCVRVIVHVCACVTDHVCVIC